MDLKTDIEELLKKKDNGHVCKPRKSEAVYNPALEETKAGIEQDRNDGLKQNRKKAVKVAAIIFILYAATKCSSGNVEDNTLVGTETTEITEPTTLHTEETSEAMSLSQQERIQKNIEDINKNVDGIKKSSDEIWNDPNVKESRENLKDTFKKTVFDYDTFKESATNNE